MEESTKIHQPSLLASPRLATLPVAALRARRNSRNWLTVNFNPVDPRTSTSVTASPHQLGETNLLHPAKVWILHPLIAPAFDNIFDIEIPPAHVNQLDL